jgi:hypothetical protein
MKYTVATSVIVLLDYFILIPDPGVPNENRGGYNTN